MSNGHIFLLLLCFIFWAFLTRPLTEALLTPIAIFCATIAKIGVDSMDMGLPIPGIILLVVSFVPVLIRFGYFTGTKGGGDDGLRLGGMK